jgi:hypothetical protein
MVFFVYLSKDRGVVKMNVTLAITNGKGEIHLGIGAIRPVPECPTGIGGMIPLIWISLLDDEIVIIKNSAKEKIKISKSQELISFCGFHYNQSTITFVRNYKFQEKLFEQLRERIGTIEWKTELSEKSIGNDYSMAYLPEGICNLLTSAFEEKTLKIIEPNINFE